MRLEPLHLSGFAHGPGQQLDHVAELAHLFGDLPHIGGLPLGLNAQLAFEPFEPRRNPTDRFGQLVELRHRLRRQLRRRHLRLRLRRRGGPAEMP